MLTSSNPFIRPKLLDLFCGAGGASVGYNRAGFDVLGVDIVPQPNYPFSFIQADAVQVATAIEFFNRSFDAIHASPPCQAFSIATLHQGRSATDKHPNLIPQIRNALSAIGKPFVIENVAGAPISKDLMLCGEQFGLRVHRHRYFEMNWPVVKLTHEKHILKGALHNCDIRDGHARQVVGNYADHDDASDAMGIYWMSRKELKEAIPPPYTEYIGKQLIALIKG